MESRQEAVFNVLNDWFDIDQHAFLKVWPELEEAMARNDGRPRSVGVLRKDPLPYRNTRPGVVSRYPDAVSADIYSAGSYKFEPRSEFIQDEEAYDA